MALDPVNYRLFVADDIHNRVMVFPAYGNACNCFASGENASYVLGQADFTHITGAKTQSGMTSPASLAYDSTNNRLFVGEIGNNRVTVFDVGPSAIHINGENASFELGQPSGTTAFTTSGANLTQSGMEYPAGLLYDPGSGRLFEADGDIDSGAGFGAGEGYHSHIGVRCHHDFHQYAALVSSRLRIG